MNDPPPTASSTLRRKPALNSGQLIFGNREPIGFTFVWTNGFVAGVTQMKVDPALGFTQRTGDRVSLTRTTIRKANKGRFPGRPRKPGNVGLWHPGFGSGV